MRPVCVYLVFTTEASFDPAEFPIAQWPTSPFTTRCSRILPFWKEVCWHLTFNDMPPLMLEADSEDKEDLPTADPDDTV